MGYVHKAYTKDRPDGPESLGGATLNIMEQGLKYCDALPTDYGQRLESPAYPDNVEYPNPDEVVWGQGIDALDLETLYFLRNKNKVFHRSFGDNHRRKQTLKANRKKRKKERRKNEHIRACAKQS